MVRWFDGPLAAFVTEIAVRNVLGIMTMRYLKVFVAITALFLVLAGPVQAQAQVTIPEPTQDPAASYRLFRTQNLYTFLLLNTRTGQISQMQWSTEDDKRFTAPVNSKPLVDGRKSGRFTLYPTQNIYTFILLDQDTGSSWQVQWGKNPLIIQIE